MKQKPENAVNGHDDFDHRLRIVALALEPALTLARAMSLPLDDLLAMTEKGYFRQYQERGLSFTTLAQRLGKSRRTIASLAGRAKRATREAGSDALTLRRLILEKLSKQAPMTEAALLRRFPGKSPELLRDALATLAADAVIERTAAGYQLVASTYSLLGEDRERRLASLEQFLQAVTDVVFQRFFSLDGRAEAFARVLSFRSSVAGLRSLGEECYAMLRARVIEADEAQQKRDNAGSEAGRNVSVALFYAEEPNAPALRR